MSSILIRRANMVAAGSNPGRLPAGYTELVYLENTSDSYIDTGIVPTATSGFIAKYTSSDNNDRFIIGCRASSSTSTRFLVARNTSSNYYGWGSTVTWNYNASSVIASINWMNDGAAIVRDFDGIVQKSNTLSALPFTPTNSIRLFHANGAGSAWLGKIYYCKISGGSNVVMDLVPAMRDSDSVVGMYDLVSNTFLTNSGTGTFNYGTL